MQLARCAIDYDPIRAAQIFDERLLGRRDELTMLSTDELAVEL